MNVWLRKVASSDPQEGRIQLGISCFLILFLLEMEMFVMRASCGV
jgi:hypothetical protein